MTTGPRIEWQCDPTVSFAMQQNDVPIVKMLRIVNEGEDRVSDLELVIASEPEFAPVWRRRVDGVGAGMTLDVGLVDLALSAAYLGSVTEATRATLTARLVRAASLPENAQSRPAAASPADAGPAGAAAANDSPADAAPADAPGPLPSPPAEATPAEPLAQATVPVDVLAYDEWAGSRSLPEILAAFVQPNHPVVEGLVSEAGRILRERTGDVQLSGYQSGRRQDVVEAASAIFEAIRRREIQYVTAPASFETSGQKIRLPDRIMTHRMGACLDLTVLFAACLEQAGLHPLIVIIKGHAFPGVWLADAFFADSCGDDGLHLRKRVELDDICVFESTSITGTAPDFESAVRAGRSNLSDLEKFLFFVDVKRSRVSRIRPLPLRFAEPDSTSVELGAARPAATPGAAGRDAAAASAAGATGSPSAGPSSQTPGDEPETPQIRLEKWKRKLLDLSLHNKLLNFKDSQKTLRILYPDLAELEDALASSRKFQLCHRPAEAEEQHPRDAKAYQLRTGGDLVDDVLRAEFGSRRLYTPYDHPKHQSKLTDIYRTAKESLEENGANTLYLALGFVAWRETDKSEARRMAPILLIPVRLERKSSNQTCTLEQADEEPQINTTLLEMLRKDFGLQPPGMDPLVTDDSGVDVNWILRTFRELLINMPRWEVVEEAWIGQFSFSKFLMWRDLQARSGELSRNRVVGHLIHTPGERFKNPGEFPDPERLDENYRPETTYCPMDADSSQLAAVHACAEGRSFVLDGPPGTGKSQTITNMIAHNLRMGKTVLFVSEKSAALNVVYSRLKGCGLGNFCLELHSNKTQKTRIMRQLEASLDPEGVSSGIDWSEVSLEIAERRERLNDYAKALHSTRACGRSVYQGISTLIRLRRAKAVALRFGAAAEFGRERMKELHNLVQEIITAGRAAGEPFDHPWRGCGVEDWSPAFQRTAEESLRGVRARLERLAPAWAAARALSPIFARAGDGAAALKSAAQLCAVLAEGPRFPSRLLTDADWTQIRDGALALGKRGRERDTARAELAAKYRPAMLRLDLDALAAKWRASHGRFILLGWLDRRAVKATLKSLLAAAGPLGAEVGEDLEKALALRTLESSVAKMTESARGALPADWESAENWNRLDEGVGQCARLRESIQALASGDLDAAREARAALALLIAEAPEQFRPEGSWGRAMGAFIAAHKEAERAVEAAQDLLKITPSEVWGAAPPSLALLRERFAVWEREAPRLKDWAHWRLIRSRALGKELLSLVMSWESGEFGVEDLQSVFDKSLMQWWTEEIIDGEPVLRNFFSPDHARLIEEFRKLDREHIRLARLEVQANLALRAPSGGAPVDDGSELGILRRQISRRRGHLPIRQLFQKIPNLLPRIKPCLLMSPLSISQYLDPSFPQFDLVIFDEASQIPVWDAIGAIARGTEAVIVGDPKQLPPTNFFGRTDDDADNEGDGVSEDMESILDDCLAAQLPHLHLKWHYRSRHESLIAFSNHHYYDNRLLTFPSPDREAGVKFRHLPEARYDKGKSRTNRGEAEAVVAEIARRLADPISSKQSIGVVTFSVAQQTLIQDLLDEAQRENPGLERFFGAEIEEPVFVKNLENVQGDERDIILFSICYGPDEQGRVSMNFGPLNRDGGQRRLNVAITRARREVLVFSSLLGDQIDLARTKSLGVRHLRYFLDFAKRGPTALAGELSVNPEADFDSPFEREVAQALAERGYETRSQVGCSGYRIDLAVIDPERSGRYTLGVECDGANYHRARTARDRDRLREEILRGLGWRIYRIWSTDWWHNPKKETEKLIQAIERARAEIKEAEAAAAVEAVGLSQVATEPPKTSNGSGLAGEERGEGLAEARVPRRSRAEENFATLRADGESAYHTPGEASGPGVAESVAPYGVAAQSRGGTADPAPQAKRAAAALPVFRPLPARRIGEPHEFHSEASAGKIREIILLALAHEGPMHIAALSRRIGAHWDLGRAGAAVQRRVESIARAEARVTLVQHDAGLYAWPDTLDPKAWAEFRTPSDAPDSKRDIEEISPEEIANAAFHSIKTNVSMPLDNLIKTTARLLGYQRAGVQIETRIQHAVGLLIERGQVRMTGNTVALAS